jgi:hypothetical protein
MKKILLAAIILGVGYYVYTKIKKPKKTKIIKDRSFEIEVLQPETE